MTNQTILSLLNYLCNEARNSLQASFGLMALGPSVAPDPAWQTCLENSKCGADRLLRSIDDIRELLSAETPAVIRPRSSMLRCAWEKPLKCSTWHRGTAPAA